MNFPGRGERGELTPERWEGEGGEAENRLGEPDSLNSIVRPTSIQSNAK